MEDIVPPITYSSSEDEFFDATSGGGRLSEDENSIPSQDMKRSEGGKVNRGIPTSPSRRIKHDWESPDEEPDWDDSNEDFDKIYENNEESDLGDVQQQHGSVLMHLLSQVRFL